MRTLMKVHLPVEKANEAMRGGKLPEIINNIIQELHPEASYYYTEHGKRTMELIFDLKEPWQIPGIVERLYNELEAEIKLTPVMNAEDLKRGLEMVTTHAYARR